MASELGLWKSFFNDVVDDDIASLAASIAYYASLSLAPLVLLAIALIGALYPSVQERFLHDVGALVGAQGKDMIRTIVESSAQRPDLRQVAGWTGAIVLLFGASAVFGQLQSALNIIWDLQRKDISGFTGFLRRRLLSAGVLLAVLFLTIVSFMVQAGINLFGGSDAAWMNGLMWVGSFMVYGLLFTLLYVYLPDGRVPWPTAWRGGMMTTVMFMIGRALIDLYLRNSDTAGAFGPAGALVVWLLWSYYSALTFLLAAEFLYSMARVRGWKWAPRREVVAALGGISEVPVVDRGKV